jgi:hypothetical protein
VAKSKAISPELNGLFTRIEKQAEEYEKAFIELNKFQRDSQRIIRENEELMVQLNELLVRNTALCNNLENIEAFINKRLEDVYNEALKYLDSTVVVSVTAKVDVILRDFQARADAAIGLIEGSDGVMQMLQNIRNLADELQMKVVVFDEKVAQLDAQFIELDRAKKDFLALENSLDERLNEFNRRITSSISESKIRYESDFNEITYRLEERIKQSIADIKQSQTAIYQKVHNADKRVAKFISIADQLEQHLSGITEKMLSDKSKQ